MQRSMQAGDYTIIKELGDGATGCVLLASDGNEEVAIKMYTKRAATHSFEGEVKCLGAVEHNNVVRMHSFGEIEHCGSHVNGIVMEYLGRGELYSYVKDTGAFSEPLGRFYARQLLEAVNACHNSGVFHRDVKLSNLVLDNNFNLKLCDFGASVRVVPENMSTLLFEQCGTEDHVCPEMLSFTCAYRGVNADSWAVGVTIFTMLMSSKPMYKAVKTDAYFRKLAENKAAAFWYMHSRSGITLSMEAKDFLLRLLCVDASKRATVGDMLQHEWLRGETLDYMQVFDEMSRRWSILQDITSTN